MRWDWASWAIGVATPIAGFGVYVAGVSIALDVDRLRDLYRGSEFAVVRGLPRRRRAVCRECGTVVWDVRRPELGAVSGFRVIDHWREQHPEGFQRVEAARRAREAAEDARIAEDGLR